MYLVLIIITVVVCAFLGMIVLIQNPKGGGLTSNFSSQSQLMGVQKTGDFLEKGTWGLAIGLMVLSLAINVAAKNGTEQAANPHQTQINKVSKPIAPANTPITLPVNPQPVAPGKK